jgi:hypothetical protein
LPGGHHSSAKGLRIRLGREAGRRIHTGHSSRLHSDPFTSIIIINPSLVIRQVIAAVMCSVPLGGQTHSKLYHHVKMKRNNQVVLVC